MVFYLKVNRNDKQSIRNIQHWIDCIKCRRESIVVFVCDSIELKEEILKKVDFCETSYTFIKSEKEDENVKRIISSITNSVWEKAGYAHITVFFHAALMGYDRYWNIDADDTYMCLSAVRMMEILLSVEQKAKEDNIDLFSLDMWRSWSHGKHWSFGITFTNGSVKWMDVMKEHCLDVEYNDRTNQNYNIDWFFSYLKSISSSELKIGTFYVEKLRFIHTDGDFFGDPIKNSFYYWENGKINYPIISNCIGIDKTNIIFEDIEKIDININAEECALSLIESMLCKERFNNYFRNEIVSMQEKVGMISEEKIINYMKVRHNITSETECVCWGLGRCFEKNYKLLRKMFNIKYVCDNDRNKWGKTDYYDMECISPSELTGRNEIFVIVTVEDDKTVNGIINQMEMMNIKNYDHINNIYRQM